MLRTDLGIPDDEYRNRLRAKWNVSSASDLSTEQAAKLIKSLRARAQAEGREAFGQSQAEKIRELQTAALGYCEKVRGQEGATPEKFEEAGLPVQSPFRSASRTGRTVR